MKVAFWIMVIVMWFFWLLYIASRNTEDHMMNTAGEPTETCWEYTGWGWNECMLKEIEWSFSNLK